MAAMFWFLLFGGFVLNAEGVYRPPVHFPRPRPRCQPCEIFEECGSACDIERTCQNPWPSRADFCTEQCVQRCVCDAENGYIRDEASGTCIIEEECPVCTVPCGPDEVLNSCASACLAEPTCQNPFPESSGVCTMQCVERCECDEAQGYIRDESTGICIPRSDCPVCPDLCPPDEHLGCAPCCPQSVVTCQNRYPPPCNARCTFQCDPICICDEGFLRDEVSGNCVELRKCPRPQHPFRPYHH